MKAIKIASVTLLVIGKVKVFVFIDSCNHVCKFHIDYDGVLDEHEKSKLEDDICNFVYSRFPVSVFAFEFSETSKAEVFKYLSSKFC